MRKKHINILIYSLFTLMLAIGCLFGVSSFVGNKALALTRGGEEVYVGTSATFNVKSGTIGTSGTDAIYNDGILNITGGTINGNIKNNGTINYSAGAINGMVTLAKGKYITLNSNPTSTIKITLENGTVGDVIAELKNGTGYSISTLNIINMPPNTKISVKNNQVILVPVSRLVIFDINASGYGTVTNSSGAAVATISVDHGSIVTIDGNKLTVGGNTYTATATTITGYTTTFSRWSIANNSTITANTTITANFTRAANTYNITYALSGGSYGTYHPTTVAYDTAFQVSNPTRTGYTFTGWTASELDISTAKYGSTSNPTTAWDGTTKVTSTYFKNLTPTNGGTVTLTANWEINKYTITFESNNENYGYTEKSIQTDVPYGSTISVSNRTITINGINNRAMGVPQVTGYTPTFDGWYIGTTKITANQTVTGDMTITANFSRTANKYTVSFQPHGSPDYCAPITVTYNSTYGTLPSPTKSGYNFGGWWTGENGTGTQVTSSTKVTRTENHTLYAKWSVVSNVSVNISASDAEEMSGNGTFTVPAGTTAHIYDYFDSILIRFSNGHEFRASVTYNTGGDYYLYSLDINGSTAFLWNDFNRPDGVEITINSDTKIVAVFNTCFDINTDILVWDDEKKRVVRKKAKDIKYTDKLLVWNFDKGCLDFAYPLFIQAHKSVNAYTEIKFSDGTILNIAREHTVFNVDLNKFCPIISDWKVYGCPVGTRVMKDNGEIVTIVNKRKVHKPLTYTNIITNYHMNCYTNGILSSTPLNNCYEIKDMKFVKDDRHLEDLSKLDGISEEWINGLRLDIIPDKVIDKMTSHNNGINSMRDYVQEKIKIMKPKNKK